MEKRISSTFEKVRGLNDVDKSDWPEVKAVFYFFHVMLLCWVGIVVLVVSLLITLRKMPQSLNRVFNYLKTAILLLLIAALAGWATSEMGRQPWLIYNLIKTSHANTYTCDTFDTMLSIISSFVLPLVLLILWVMLQKAELKYFLSHKN